MLHWQVTRRVRSYPKIISHGVIYMSDEWRVPASDSRGHSARVQFRVQPGMIREVDEIIQSRKFPYQGQSDLLRHALYRHLRYLETFAMPTGEPVVNSVGRMVDAILAVVQDDEYHNDFRLTMQLLNERITDHVRDGGHNEARRLVMQIVDLVNQMPAGYWQRKYSEELQAKWGSFLSAGKVNLIALVDDPDADAGADTDVDISE